MLRKFIESQIYLSKTFDKLLPKHLIKDGNSDFIKNVIPNYLKPLSKIYEVGGGKNPYLSLEQKSNISAFLIGLDIDAQELNKAQAGLYDQTICIDITNYTGLCDADLVICQALLEHVSDTSQALHAISTILKPGGIALIFVPSRNALFAQLNLLLPQKTKKKILHSIYPSTILNQGFPAYYNKCTPRDMKRIVKSLNLKIIDEKYYHTSSYFSFFFPLYFFWRIWIIFFYLLDSEQSSETFFLAIQKPS